MLIELTGCANADRAEGVRLNDHELRLKEEEYWGGCEVEAETRRI